MGRLTVSAFSFPQLTQIDSKIFFTLTKKPAANNKIIVLDVVLCTYRRERLGVQVQCGQNDRGTLPSLHRKWHT